MKKIITLLSLLILSFNVKSQCGIGSPSGDTLRLFGSGQSTNLLLAEGNYAIFYVEAGASYNISTCIGSMGSGNINDTQLSVYDASNNLLAYNDDYCGLQSTVNFTSNTCGYAKVNVYQYYCNSSGIQVYVYFNQNSNPSFTAQSVTDSLFNATCFSSNNGAIKTYVTGGTAPYHYTWSTTDTTANIYNLPAGTYTLSVHDSLGCIPDTNKFIYTITQPALDTISQSISLCYGLSYTIGSHSYTTTGVYSDTLQNNIGCDSIVKTNLTILMPDSTHQSDFICDASGYLFYSTTFTDSGTYYHTLTNMNNCDSVIVLHLTDHRTSSTYSSTACNSYTFNSNTLTSSGTYTMALTNAAGCDSIISLNLIINNSSSHSYTQTACYSYNFNGSTLTSSGTYTAVISNAAGCDSSITLDLTINTIDTSVTQNSNVITANSPSASYQWVDCNNSYSIISGEINQTYTAVNDGSYAVIITQNTCVDTSSCFTVNTTGISKTFAHPEVKLYPNPTCENITLHLNQILSGTHILIYNALGQVVLNQAINNKTTILNLNDFSQGIYQINLLSINGIIYQSKLIKQ